MTPGLFCGAGGDTANGYSASDHNRTYDPGGFGNDGNCKLVHDPGGHGFNVEGASTYDDGGSDSDTSNPLTTTHDKKLEHIDIRIQSI
jgi:hypothetical protein